MQKQEEGFLLSPGYEQEGSSETGLNPRRTRKTKIGWGREVGRGVVEPKRQNCGLTES